MLLSHKSPYQSMLFKNSEQNMFLNIDRYCFTIEYCPYLWLYFNWPYNPQLPVLSTVKPFCELKQIIRPFDKNITVALLDHSEKDLNQIYKLRITAVITNQLKRTQMSIKPFRCTLHKSTHIKSISLNFEKLLYWIRNKKYLHSEFIA